MKSLRSRKFVEIFFYTVAIASCFTLNRGDISANAQNIPQAQCIQNAFGQQKCGYNCIRNAFGEMACADWPGGKCTQNAFGEQQCGPPAPANWFESYTNRSDSDSCDDGVCGAWAVKFNDGSTGFLRMRGKHGRLVAVGSSFVVEQKMTLSQTQNRSYWLRGEITASNLNTYNADNFYIEKFYQNFKALNCNQNGKNCEDVNLSYLGK